MRDLVRDVHGLALRIDVSVMGKDFESGAQLQCSRKSSCLQPMKPHQKSTPSASFRLSDDGERLYDPAEVCRRNHRRASVFNARSMLPFVLI